MSSTVYADSIIYNWLNGISKLLCSVCAEKYPEKTDYIERISGLHKCQECKVNTATWWGYVKRDNNRPN